MTTIKPPRELPDFEDKNAMFLLLQDHLIISHKGWVYLSDWSDLRIAQAVNPTFRAHHAATIRRAKFGILVKPSPSPLPPPTQLDILEARISRIIDVLSDNTSNPDRHRRYLLDGPSTTAHLDDI